MSKPWLIYCRYPRNGHQRTQTHRQTHCHMAIIHFHSYKVHSVHRMFTACSLFWSCSTQHQLWCLTKEFPLVSCLYEWVCVCVCVCACACACAARREVIDSPLHIQPISGLRSRRPCKQPLASFPLSFTPSLSPQSILFSYKSNVSTEPVFENM